MRVLAVYNIKGGVGKTAAAVNLAHLASLEGLRTLVWDLDPQGAATFYFRIRPRLKGGPRKLLKGHTDLAERIRETDHPLLDVLPSDFSYRHMDLILDEAKKPARRLSKVLEPLKEAYDLVFLDCPPSVSILSEAVFGASDALLVPLIPTTLSLRTLDQILGFRDECGLPHLPVLPFFSMVDRRKNMHLRILETAPRERPDILATLIPYASDVERMGIERQPLACFAPRSPSTLAYRELWREIQARLGDAG